MSGHTISDEQTDREAALVAYCAHMARLSALAMGCVLVNSTEGKRQQWYRDFVAALKVTPDAEEEPRHD